MHTFHIHINGLVQGVGFRPHVYKLATQAGIKGCVNNGIDGVHLIFNANEEDAAAFYNDVITYPPPNAIITHHIFKKTNKVEFDTFSIIESTNEETATSPLLLTPDVSICSNCKQELFTPTNKRFRYPFITCLECGPRYSITQSLPYDRQNTTMDYLSMCPDCKKEYNDPENKRHFSQTNSCKTCEIKMQLFENTITVISSETEDILQKIKKLLSDGKIIAVKGVGGYLLMCDATNESTIQLLRKRKHRKSKPFAVIYPTIQQAKETVCINEMEQSLLEDKSSPIVLCKLKETTPADICINEIAPGLDKLGIMLPYTGLLALIASDFNKPLIATSGNISGAPIIYKDKDALAHLFDVADFVVTFNRDIIAPQDDSVIQVSDNQQKIIIRRSRGLAPNYYPNPFPITNKCTLALGADMKGAFAFQQKDKLYVSQFLGNQQIVESKTCLEETLQHTVQLLQSIPDEIIVDSHPGYAIAQYGKEIAQHNKNTIKEVQHHKAHFAAVLAENDLLNFTSPILGIIWDGIGYGEDKNIWGGEFFIYKNNSIERKFHWQYFPYLLGDKMSFEPRLSALSVLQNVKQKEYKIESNFTANEWKYYQQYIIDQKHIQTSSMGRFLDAISSILEIQQYNYYEGEAAMKLEVAARKNTNKTNEFYSFEIENQEIKYEHIITEIFTDLKKNRSQSYVAEKVFNTLAQIVIYISDQTKCNHIACSGGVFQNALLVDKILDILPITKKIYFHKQLSPNDESISFGQLAYQYL